jgi:hypothetical protein
MIVSHENNFSVGANWLGLMLIETAMAETSERWPSWRKPMGHRGDGADEVGSEHTQVASEQSRCRAGADDVGAAAHDAEQSRGSAGPEQEEAPGAEQEPASWRVTPRPLHSRQLHHMF